MCFCACEGNCFSECIDGGSKVGGGACEGVFSNEVLSDAGLFEACEGVGVFEDGLQLAGVEASCDVPDAAIEDGGILACEACQACYPPVLVGDPFQNPAVRFVEKFCPVEQSLPRSSEVLSDVRTIPSIVQPGRVFMNLPHTASFFIRFLLQHRPGGAILFRAAMLYDYITYSTILVICKYRASEKYFF